ISQILMAAGLIAVLPLGLLPALLAGLLVYNIIVFGSKSLCRIGVLPKAAKILLLLIISLVVITLFSVGCVRLVSFVSGDPESIVGLIKHIAEVVITARNFMPEWSHQYLPSNIEGWQAELHEALLGNAQYLSAVGRGTGMFLIHVLFGMIIGGLAALNASEVSSDKPFTKALEARGTCLSLAFRRIVFSQIRISALNTILTGLFLGIVMPAIGYHLPLVKTMIVVTFIVGLMPIIGNVISNTIIFLIALGVSPGAAVGALVFLVAIHKLEYFVNAHIIGSRISAHAWELLVAMLVMDAAFGIPGLVAAPIYYAYIKDELSAQKLV
ncbi:MAG: hypothetical protein WC464_06070, partial [Bdellovibrionales bacterium]